MTPRCFYFGCWNQAGHYCFEPGGRSLPYCEEDKIVWYHDDADKSKAPERRHLDGTLAPRRRPNGQIVWEGRHGRSSEYHSQECPQGEFLIHHLSNGFTAMSWWDRKQGDSRGACNSTVLLDGRHDANTMQAALAQHFPHVLANLTKAGVVLVDLTPLVTGQQNHGFT